MSLFELREKAYGIRRLHERIGLEAAGRLGGLGVCCTDR